jgi:streptogramin lyase
VSPVFPSHGQKKIKGKYKLFNAPESSDGSIVVGPDGNFWYITTSANRLDDSLVQFNPNGSSRQFPLPSQGSNVSFSGLNVVNGPDGRLWMGTYNCTILASDTSGNFQEYVVTPSSECAIQLGSSTPGQGIWFTLQSYGQGQQQPQVGYINPSTGAVTSFSYSATNTYGPIVLGPDGNMWFGNVDTVGRVTPSGTVSLFPTAPQMQVGDIIAGPDGNLWYVGQSEYDVGTINTAGQILSEIQVGLNPGPLYTAIIGPDDDVWVSNAGALVHMTSPTQFTTIPYPRSHDSYPPANLVLGPDHNVWFTTFGTGGGKDPYGIGVFIPKT